VVKYNELGQFLFQNESGLVRVAPLIVFDKLDFIFIDGDLPLRPWSHQSQQVGSIQVLLESPCRWKQREWYEAGMEIIEREGGREGERERDR